MMSTRQSLGGRKPSSSDLTAAGTAPDDSIRALIWRCWTRSQTWNKVSNASRLHAPVPSLSAEHVSEVAARCARRLWSTFR